MTKKKTRRPDIPGVDEIPEDALRAARYASIIARRLLERRPAIRLSGNAAVQLTSWIRTGRFRPSRETIESTTRATMSYFRSGDRR